MRLPFRLIDAFAHGPFTGNPAGVVILESPLEEDLMQRIAAEVNQAETAFVWPQGDRFGLRWFTPTDEVDLCGHATLATAHALDRGEVFFETKSGTLGATKLAHGWQLDFPAEPFKESSDDVPANAMWVGRNRMDVVAILESEESVLTYQPNFDEIARIDARGLIITAQAERAGVDYVCRFFGPQVGVPEDSVTGSAHCGLSPLWSDRLEKTALRGFQASPRGGFVETELLGERVHLRGAAFTVVEGELCL